MKIKILWLLMFLLVSCSPATQSTPDPNLPVTSPPADQAPTSGPDRNPFAPRSDDEKLTHGMVYLDEASLVIRESYPPQISLSLKGNLPTPCNELRLNVNPPDSENKIIADAYSVIDPSKVCTEVLEPFQEYIDLGTFSPGHYSVWVNGDLAGEFDS
jgi:hypothetical protein